MNAVQDIALQSACELHERIVRRELSPVEVTRACLEQIERFNPELQALCTLAENAVEQAELMEKLVMRGGPLPPLIGLPVGIKDVTETAGLRTTYGSPLYADHVPDEDAWVVQRLKGAGAVIIGKTNTPEFAAGANTFNALFGCTRNPWGRDLTVGGSTGGGGAGLAAGLFALAEGTDLGGSLRIPAAFCGVVGLRPSPGLVPTYPSSHLWDTLSVTGLMARTAEDIALGLEAVAGPCPMSPVGQSIHGRELLETVKAGPRNGLRAAYCPDISGIGIDPGVDRVCREALSKLTESGVIVEEINVDLSYAREAFLVLRGYWMVAQHHERLDQLDALGDNLRQNIESYLDAPFRLLGQAEQARNRLWRQFFHLFETYDHLLTPTMAVPPFAAEQNYPEEIAGKKMNSYIDWVAPTFLLSLTGLPVASVPCGLDAGGLPVGIQIVGPQRHEEKCLALARRIQELRPIGHPPLLTREKT